MALATIGFAALRFTPETACSHIQGKLMRPKDHHRHKLGTGGWLRASVSGGWSAEVGGANVRVGALRVAFWSALAMAVTTAVGAAVGRL